MGTNWAELPGWMGKELSASLRSSDFTCLGYDFCDRPFT